MKIYILLFIIAIVGVSCSNDPRNTGLEFAPQMYHALPVEPYIQDSMFKYNPNGMSMREAVPGTVARGKADYVYPYTNTNEGMEAASKELVNPIKSTDKNMAEGERLYKLYCSHCHGAEGKGDGSIIKAEKFPNPPPYDGPRVKALTDGKMFHSITYGINMMGSHASQLSPNERWMIVNHIKKLRGDSATDTTKKVVEANNNKR